MTYKTAILVVVAVITVFFSANIIKAQQLPLVPPFDAWVTSQDDVWVRGDYRSYAPSVGLLRYGNIVRITACENNNCSANGAWAQIGPFGAIRMSVVEPIATVPVSREGQFWNQTADNFLWAKARRTFLTSTGERFRAGDEIVFRQDSVLLLTRGLLERPDGGTVAASNLTIFEPSTFSGWVNPPEKFAFALRDTVIQPRSVSVSRYRRFNVERLPSSSSINSIITTEGIVARDDVRVGYKHTRPSSVPTGTRWVHVDLDQQILTAYDYNDRLVFATLVSTGRGNNQTDAGVFQVRRKTYHTHMSGGGGGRGHYSVDAVPWVMFFDEAIALHGAFWHDQFGTKRSHGCVNLSISDAKFLFNFAPMEIPQGWRAIHPIALNMQNNLWVVVE